MSERKENSSSVVSRRPRGRPLGSKNKSKAGMNMIVKYESPYALHSRVIEIAAGSDVLETIFNYAQRPPQGICILAGDGKVSHVTLRQSNGTILPLQGTFQIISISGTILPPSMPQAPTGLSVYLSSTTGQVVGGSVVPPLLASTPLLLMAACFADAELVKLPFLPSHHHPPSASAHLLDVIPIRNTDLNSPSSPIQPATATATATADSPPKPPRI
ncbi:AT-hook motif nuclear-localized protein 27-like [Cicer arietinum]|uniref:AT-hook motif nuclear-localized protein 20-like n=1 Tax=Cicer arietinum TaxID=3827 RepID=A0A1S2YA68_CICAR|nr:AT-hook motif nuclear-localized protein 20-like [Cicer arietinum]